MMGTAATMGIDENLALAARRGKFRSLMPGITAKEKAQYKELLAELDLGLENRITSRSDCFRADSVRLLRSLWHHLRNLSFCFLMSTLPHLILRLPPRCLTLPRKIVQKDNLTTLMITHNMKDAIAHGNRLIMMNSGNIIFDISGEEKKETHSRGSS